MKGIEIPIGAPLERLDKDLKNAKSKLTAFATSTTQTSGSLNTLTNAVDGLSGGFEQTAQALRPLVSEFTNAKSQGLSTSQAVKGLTGSLIGGGGLALGATLAASAILLLVQNPEKAAAALNYLSGQVSAMTETQRKYRDELVKTGANAQTEITNLNILVGIAKDETLSRDARTEAIKKLNKEYPEQLGSLKLEGIESINTAKAIDVLSQSLLRKAKIEATSKLIGEAFAKQLKAQTANTIEQASVLSSAVQLGLNTIGVRNTVALTNGLQSQSKAFKLASDEASVYSNILKKLMSEEATAGTLFDDPKKKPAKTTKGKSVFEQRGDLLKQLTEQKSSSLLTGLEQNQSVLQNQADIIAKSLKQGIKQNFKGEPLIPIASIFGSGGSDYVGKELYTPFQILKDEINFDLLPQLGSSFKTFFDEMLMRGTFSFDKLGQSIKSTFASVLASEATNGLLKLLGSKGAPGGSGGGLFKALGGVLGIGGKALAGGGAAAGGASAAAGTAATGGALIPILAGVAAVAGIATLFKKKQTPLPAQQTNSYSSAAISSNSDFGGGRVVFEISGTNLIGVLNRAGAKLQRFGP